MNRTVPPPTSQERDELAATVRAVLTRYAPAPEGVDDPPGGYDAGLWKRLGELGISGLGVPETLGGAGGDYLDCHAVLVEIGRALVASPYPATLIATQALLSTEGLTAAGEPLTELVGGATATLVDGLRVEDGTGTLHGRAERVLDGARADLVLATGATATGTGLFAVDPATLRREVVTTMDRTLHLATVVAAGAPVVPLGRVAPERLRDLRTVMTTADQIGGARRCLTMLVEYLGQRVQFGRPVGSFQAVKHRLADLLVLVEAAESASWAAAAAWAAGAPDTSRLAAVAGSWCGEAYEQVAAETVQLHGGIAITWEHPAHRYFKHAHTTATLFGTPAAHRGRLVALLRETETEI
jgi:alkylation response protein AidB-like acyl-CoA dehydrogenase